MRQPDYSEEDYWREQWALDEQDRLRELEERKELYGESIGSIRTTKTRPKTNNQEAPDKDKSE